MCEAFGVPPWEADLIPSRWLNVCHAYLVWKSEEEKKAVDGDGGRASKKGSKLPPPREHSKPSSRA